MATQEERRTKTRQAIIDAAFIAYEQQGSPEVSLESIAEHAGVTKGTIHYHFRNRIGLMRAVALSVFSDIEQRVNTASKATDDDNAKVYVTALLSAQATPTGRVLFTLGDELARTNNLDDIDPYQYLRHKVSQLGFEGSAEVIAAAITQFGRQLAYGLIPAAEIERIVLQLMKGAHLGNDDQGSTRQKV